MNAPKPKNPIDQLAELTGGKWPNLTAARQLAVEKRIELERVLSDLGSGDTSIVVFGSLARDEFTPGSDLDWTLLVDGIANPSHFDTAQKIARQLDEAGFEGPRPRADVWKLRIQPRTDPSDRRSRRFKREHDPKDSVAARVEACRTTGRL